MIYTCMRIQPWPIFTPWTYQASPTCSVLPQQSLSLAVKPLLFPHPNSTQSSSSGVLTHQSNFTSSFVSSFLPFFSFDHTAQIPQYSLFHNSYTFLHLTCNYFTGMEYILHSKQHILFIYTKQTGLTTKIFSYTK